MFKPDNVAWLATVLCILMTASAANKAANSRPRVFTVLSMFATSWAVLYPYYDKSRNLEILPAISGIMMMYVGAFLCREASERKQRAQVTLGVAHKVGHCDRAALWLLAALVSPSVLHMRGDAKIPINPDNAAMSVATVITIIGYVYIWAGLVRLWEGRKFVAYLMAAILIPYSCLEIAFTYLSWKPLDAVAGTTVLSDLNARFFDYAFSAAKLTFTTTTVSLILWITVPEGGKPQGLFENLRMILRGLLPHEADAQAVVSGSVTGTATEAMTHSTPPE